MNTNEMAEMRLPLWLPSELIWMEKFLAKPGAQARFMETHTKDLGVAAATDLWHVYVEQAQFERTMANRIASMVT